MSLLNIGTSALLANQTALATTSNNISNLNTEGYNRQRVEQGALQPQFKGGFYLGSGVNVSAIERLYDQFLTEQIRSTSSQEKSLSTFYQFSRQVDELLGSDALSISNGFDKFFNAVQEVADDPTSIAARRVMLSEAETLANRFNTLDSQLKGFNAQINQNLESSVRNVNQLTQSIAEVNQAIIDAKGSSTSANPNDLLDKRDQLLLELSKLVSVSTTQQENGALNVFIGNGQAVVLGTSTVRLSTVQDPTDTSRLNVAYGANAVNISNQLNGGQIGGLLSVRNDLIDKAQAEIDALAIGFTETMNAQHNVGLTLNGAAGGNLFEPSDPLGDPPPGAGNIRLAISDPRDIAMAFPVAVQTNPGNQGSGQIEVSAIDGSGAGFDAENALLSNVLLEFDAASNLFTVTYDGNSETFSYIPGTDGGMQFDLSDIGLADLPVTIKISGVPQAGDQFNLSNNFTNGNFIAVGDNRNALALAEIQSAKTLTALDPVTGLPVGGVATRSFGDAYGELVGNVATRTQQADNGQQTQKGLLDQSIARAQAVSGVNLDEEAANLIKFQQSYQAAAQIITVSNTVFDTLLNSL